MLYKITLNNTTHIITNITGDTNLYVTMGEYVESGDCSELSPGTYFITNSNYQIIANFNGTSFTYGTPYNLGQSTAYTVACCWLNANKCMILRNNGDNIYVYVFSVNGTTITYVTNSIINNYGDRIRGMSLQRISDTKAIALMYDGVNGYNTYLYLINSANDNTLTIGNNYSCQILNFIGDYLDKYFVNPFYVKNNYAYLYEYNGRTCALNVSGMNISNYYYEPFNPLLTFNQYVSFKDISTEDTTKFLNISCGVLSAGYISTDTNYTQRGVYKIYSQQRHNATYPKISSKIFKLTDNYFIASFYYYSTIYCVIGKNDPTKYNSDITFGAEVAITDLAKIPPDTNKGKIYDITVINSTCFVVTYVSSSDSYLYQIVCTVNDTAITAGTPQQVSTDTVSTFTVNLHVTENKLMIWYYSSAASHNYFKIATININAKTISYGTTQSVSNFSGDYLFDSCLINKDNGLTYIRFYNVLYFYFITNDTLSSSISTFTLPGTNINEIITLTDNYIAILYESSTTLYSRIIACGASINTLTLQTITTSLPSAGLATFVKSSPTSLIIMFQNSTDSKMHISLWNIYYNGTYNMTYDYPSNLYFSYTTPRLISIFDDTFIYEGSSKEYYPTRPSFVKIINDTQLFFGIMVKDVTAGSTGIAATYGNSSKAFSNLIPGQNYGFLYNSTNQLQLTYDQKIGIALTQNELMILK
jgi:hypothetical protein